MLHNKFRDNRLNGSGEDFEGFLTYNGGHLGHVTSIMLLNFNFLVHKSLHTKFGSKWPTGF